MNKNQAIFFDYIDQGLELKQGVNTRQSYQKHTHEEFSIGYVCEGESTISVGQKELLIQAGEGLIIPSHVSHMCSPKNINHWSFKMLYISESLIGNELNLREVRKMNSEECLLYTKLLSAIEEKVPLPYIEEMLSHLLGKIGLEDQREFKHRDEQITSIATYLENNLERAINLDELSLEFGINKYTLIRKFNLFYNTTPMAYHFQLRVARAKKLLENGWDVMAVCDHMGFYDQAHFIRSFKKIHGITPNSFYESIEIHKNSF